LRFDYSVEIIGSNFATRSFNNAAHLVRPGNAVALAPLPNASRANVSNAASHRFIVQPVGCHVMIELHETEHARIGHGMSSPDWAATNWAGLSYRSSMATGLKSLRLRRGWTIEKAADAFGRSRDGYNKIERGERRLSSNVIERACQIYDVSPTEVLGGAPSVGVRLIGSIGAGSEVHYFEDKDNSKESANEEVDRPPESNLLTAALMVKGDIMYPIADDGDIIYYDDIRTFPTEDMIGRMCVVALADNRILVRRLYQGRAPNLFNLTSANAPPMQDVELLWAAKVRWIKPR